MLKLLWFCWTAECLRRETHSESDVGPEIEWKADIPDRFLALFKEERETFSDADIQPEVILKSISDPK